MAVRIGLLTLGACVWWMVGLQVEAAYGVNVLKYTETVPSTTATSLASEILRGLGYWYFYGTRPGRPLDQLGGPLHPEPLADGDLASPCPSLAFVGAVFVRWRDRAYFLLILVVGIVLAVGPFPYSNPTALGGCSSPS